MRFHDLTVELIVDLMLHGALKIFTPQLLQIMMKSAFFNAISQCADWASSFFEALLIAEWIIIIN